MRGNVVIVAFAWLLVIARSSTANWYHDQAAGRTPQGLEERFKGRPDSDLRGLPLDPGVVARANAWFYRTSAAAELDGRSLTMLTKDYPLRRIWMNYYWREIMGATEGDWIESEGFPFVTGTTALKIIQKIWNIHVGSGAEREQRLKDSARMDQYVADLRRAATIDRPKDNQEFFLQKGLLPNTLEQESYERLLAGTRGSTEKDSQELLDKEAQLAKLKQNLGDLDRQLLRVKQDLSRLREQRDRTDAALREARQGGAAAAAHTQQLEAEEVALDQQIAEQEEAAGAMVQQKRRSSAAMSNLPNWLNDLSQAAPSRAGGNVQTGAPSRSRSSGVASGSVAPTSRPGHDPGFDLAKYERDKKKEINDYIAKRQQQRQEEIDTYWKIREYRKRPGN